MKEKNGVYYFVWVLLICYVAFIFVSFATGLFGFSFPLGILLLVLACVPIGGLIVMYRQRKNSKEDNYYSKNIYK